MSGFCAAVWARRRVALTSVLSLLVALLVGCGGPAPDGSGAAGSNSASATAGSSDAVVAAGAQTSRDHARAGGVTVPTSPSASPSVSAEARNAPSPSHRSASDASHPSAPATPKSVSVAARANTIVALLATLPVKGRAPKTGYDRELFGPAWTDDVTVQGGHNGCDTRNDILRRDLTDITIKPGSNGCTVLSGILHDPYTGAIIDFTRGEVTSDAVQIDHVVALLDAWQTGAQGLDEQQRKNLANDPMNLQAVNGPTNEAKGAGDAATWLPPNKGYRCSYVSRQVQVKAKYHLWVTPAEHDAILRVLRGCGAAASVVPTAVSVPPPSGSHAASANTTATHAPTPDVDRDCYPLSNGGNCYRINEFCATRYRGTSGVDAFGDPITCVQDGQYWRWQRG